MTPARWQEIKRLFDAAMERPPAEREAFLEATCQGDAELRAEVSALLESLAEAGSRYEAPLISADPLVNRQLGPYRVLRRLGSGGMGSVYLAERADDQFRRVVAIKAIRPELLDDHTRRRFANERQTLAVLDHPHIVMLLDGGTTEDGIPYLVMDYVEGRPIDQFCRERGLSIAERLELFLPLCAAVHYAHQNLIVHRDLKPANVLVTADGVPKLLDFGIAKLLRPEYAAAAVGLTRTLAQPMTPEYASPEQILGHPLTTASDVYALGVLLFTLLTGRHPFEGRTSSSYELERAICETDAGKPSDAAPGELARQLRGDLDTIVLTAMRREPQKRYASAERLAEDIRRYQAGRPIAARGEAALYRAGKFVGRHKVAVTAGVVAAGLLAALAVSDHVNRLRAEQRFAALRDLANFATNDLDKAMRTGGTAGRLQLVTKTSAYLDRLASEAKGDDALALEVVNGYVSVADTQGNLFAANIGQRDAAAATAAKAVALARQLAARHPTDRTFQVMLRRSYLRAADTAPTTDGAIASYRGALAASRDDPMIRATLLSKIASLQQDSDTAGALESERQCEAAAREWLAAKPGDRKALSSVAFARESEAWFGLLAGETSPREAERLVREAIGLYEKMAGEHPDQTARRNLALAYKRLAEVLKRGGQTNEALSVCRRSVAASEALHAEDPTSVQFAQDVAQQRVLLLDLLLARGLREEARAETARTVEYLKPLAQAEPPDRIVLADYVIVLTGTPFAEFSSADETLAYAQKAADLMHGSDPETMDLLAKACRKAGKLADAVAAEQKALDLLPPAKPGAESEKRRQYTAGLAALAAQASQKQRGK